jgi:hypothetical protein
MIPVGGMPPRSSTLPPDQWSASTSISVPSGSAS